MKTQPWSKHEPRWGILLGLLLLLNLLCLGGVLFGPLILPSRACRRCRWSSIRINANYQADASPWSCRPRISL